MARTTIILVFCALILTVFAGAPPSFCKCTCFSNSTIIALSTNTDKNPRASCTVCNKAFCLSQSLPICKNAEDKDVFTTCFQRDSRKDQIVVLTFIATTLGLLGWAAVRKVVDKRKESSGPRIGDGGQGYVAVGR